MTRLSAEWLNEPSSQRAIGLLSEAGHQAYFVGGCVRNGLLGAPVTDIDIATDAVPDRVLALADAAGLKAVPTGIEHGTVTVIAGETPFEITTFRKDIETYGRHAQVVFTTDVAKDAHRRDFTMNALYADRAGVILDPLGGLQDLRDRKLRFIDDAEQRIREDYLRILRFFRFHAWYADPITGLDPDGLAACAALADGLDHISRERIGSEIKKLLAAPDPARSLGAMHQSGVLGHVLPGSDPAAVFLIIASYEVDPILRLAALGGDEAASRLRLSRADARRVSLLRDAAAGGTPAAELGYRLGERDAVAALHLRAALLEKQVDPAELEAATIGSTQHFPIQAADLMRDFSGPALGTKLDQLEAAWIASGFQLGKSDLLRL